jgi:hypothetical protein
MYHDTFEHPASKNNMPTKRRATSELSSPPTKRERPTPDKNKSKVSTPDSERPDTISAERRTALLDQYPSLLPAKLTDLDEQRYTTIPASIAKRASSSHGAHITEDELVTLVEWKLRHGTFRPALLGMAKQHPPALIVATTTEAFALLPADAGGALKALTALKGIGPATASLVLSCANDTTPFFSDELFRWVMWDEPGGGGWARKIKYTEKEYTAFVEKVGAILEKQQGVTSRELEKIAWVLARE